MGGVWISAAMRMALVWPQGARGHMRPQAGLITPPPGGAVLNGERAQAERKDIDHPGKVGSV